MPNAYLTFGVDLNGEWQSINDTPKGRSPLVCPWCGIGLIAKKSVIKTPHFAHDGTTCHPSTVVTANALLPTVESDPHLDADERKYLQRLIRYKDPSRIYAWPSMQSALNRLLAMNVLCYKSEPSPAFLEVQARLKDQIDSQGNPSPKLAKIFDDLAPMIDLWQRWNEEQHRSRLVVSPAYLNQDAGRANSVLNLDISQRFWLEGFWRRQHIVAPEAVTLIEKKVEALSRQQLYVLHVHGDFLSGTVKEMIKIGMTAREVRTRIKEIEILLQAFGSVHSVKLVGVAPHYGRLERPLHQKLIQDLIPLGPHQEFFKSSRLQWVLEGLASLPETPFVLPSV